MIQVNNLTTGYNKGSPILKEFSYEFDVGIYGILGRSGCGKTTLLRTIAGLLKPLEGSILCDGVNTYKNNRCGIYMMHQNYTSFDWMTCLENVLIAKKVISKITQNDYDKAFELFVNVGLAGYLDQYPGELSGGMRQRLALARTLFANPKVILMDEPLSALDEKTRRKMQDLIIDIHKKTNNTIIMVTHSQNEAEYMCDKIINF